MPRPGLFFACAVSALSTVLLAQDGDPSEPGLPALFAWADVDGEGRLDLATVGGEGTLQLLLNAGEGRFEDVTEEQGLSGIGDAALALWADYDADGRLDLFVGAREGASRLFHNDGGVFVDVGLASGLESEGPVLSAHWLDHDGDGRLDLHVVTARANELYRGLEGGFFTAVELPALATPLPPVSPEVERETPEPEGPPIPPGAGERGEGRRVPEDRPAPADRPRSAALPATQGPTISSASLPPMTVFGCAQSIKDQANPGSCLQASMTPALGMLYPLSANLFVAVGGNVGIGTTTPTTKLEVAGTVRITNTLTLAPSGDQALDVSAGSIYKGGALFIHTKGGVDNTAIGREALASVTTGQGNTASGAYALRYTTTGQGNTAGGDSALRSNTYGFSNTASGYRALYSNTAGNYNAASGANALFSNTTGFNNTACGSRALFSNTTGTNNTASGYGTLYSNTTGNYNAASGAKALYSNTTGFNNTACGSRALYSNTYGYGNTASGYRALFSNTNGFGNTASGDSALRHNTTARHNTASGCLALFSNTTGGYNTASGFRALYHNTTGTRNTASGASALRYTTGSRNIALGYRAGVYLNTGSDNIDIGNVGVGGEAATIRIGSGAQTKAFIAGIRGVTTGLANAIPVLVDSSGQLGTVSSSRRFKEEIADMGELTDRLLELRPVVFRYKPEVQAGERPLEYGLIAEEVAEVFPELVVYDEEGQPFTVKYHLLSSMLLNELEKVSSQQKELCSRLAALEEQIASTAMGSARPR